MGSFFFEYVTGNGTKAEKVLKTYLYTVVSRTGGYQDTDMCL